MSRAIIDVQVRGKKGRGKGASFEMSFGSGGYQKQKGTDPEKRIALAQRLRKKSEPRSVLYKPKERTVQQRMAKSQRKLGGISSGRKRGVDRVLKS